MHIAKTIEFASFAKGALKSALFQLLPDFEIQLQARRLPNLRDFVNGVYRDNKEHLRAFVQYVKATYLNDEGEQRIERFAAAVMKLRTSKINMIRS